MKIYLDASDAVSDLHKNGFTNDFQLIGDNLLWVTERVLIQPERFAVLEYHRIIQPKSYMRVCHLFAIIALDYNVSGILTVHFKNCTIITPPPGLGNKLDELRTQAVINYPTFFAIRN